MNYTLLEFLDVNRVNVFAISCLMQSYWGIFYQIWSKTKITWNKKVNATYIQVVPQQLG